jgi:hypothetical protein
MMDYGYLILIVRHTFLSLRLGPQKDINKMSSTPILLFIHPINIKQTSREERINNLLEIITMASSLGS